MYCIGRIVAIEFMEGGKGSLRDDEEDNTSLTVAVSLLLDVDMTRMVVANAATDNIVGKN